ncbi:MAG: flagellin, partial [Pseudomonadota bacterium]|nr:flagellin [Pseudomonadota bacterium]
MSSILTNNGAMVALQTLKSVNMDLNDTQSQISTGKRIGSAKDNAAVWAISKTMDSDIAGYNSVQESLGVGEATVAVALPTVRQASCNEKHSLRDNADRQDNSDVCPII